MSEDVTGAITEKTTQPQFAVIFTIGQTCDRVLADDQAAAEMWQSKILAASHGKATVRIDPLVPMGRAA